MEYFKMLQKKLSTYRDSKIRTALVFLIAISEARRHWNLAFENERGINFLHGSLYT